MQLRLVHPGRPGEDRIATLERIDVDPDRAARCTPAASRWRRERRDSSGPVTWQVVLESPRWRVDDSFTGQGGEFAIKAR